jgi:hypothetical protein
MISNLLLKQILVIGVLFSSISFSYSQVNTYDSSDSLSCDGAAHMDSIALATNIVWYSNGVVMQNNGAWFINLCPGVYTVTYTNGFGNSVSDTFNIGVYIPNPCQGFSASIFNTQVTDTVNCDGSAEVYISYGTAPYSYLWNSGSTLDSISNLCSGYYNCSVTDANGCAFTTSTYISDVFFQSDTNLTIFNSTDPNNCDGGAMMDSVSINNAIWSQNGIVIQNGGYMINYLCPGLYDLTYIDSLGNTVTTSFVIEQYNPSTDPCVGFSINFQLTGTSDATTCDGSIITSVYGGTSPYTYNWNNGSTINSQSNLCIGSYICTVTDQNGCTVTESHYLNEEIYYYDSLLVLTNTSFPGGTIIDSVSTEIIEDCLIDYGSIASASITNYVSTSIDTVLITWTLIDTLGQVAAVYTIPTYVYNPTIGVFEATLVIYCTQKSMGINTIMIRDQFYIQELDLQEENEINIKLVNPITNEIQISFGDIVNGTVVLMDMNGRVLSENSIDNSNNLTIESSNLSQGTYLLQVNIAGKVNTYKLMK